MVEQFLTRLAATIAAFVAAALVVVAALAFLGYAAYLALLGAVSPALAAMITGLGAILFAILIVATTRLLTRGKRASAHRRESANDIGAAQRLAGEIGGQIGQQLGSLTRLHKGPVLAASLLAGVAVGASPRLRGLLLDLMLPR
jgi:hypothetical protein